jgi:hypothetical protein
MENEVEMTVKLVSKGLSQDKIVGIFDSSCPYDDDDFLKVLQRDDISWSYVDMIIMGKRIEGCVIVVQKNE